MTISRWFSTLTPLSRSLTAMDQAILALYDERGLSSYHSNWSQVLLVLDESDGRTIKELADLIRVKHASMSQRIAGMTAAGLVQSSPGADARTRVISLTDAGRDMLDFARREWDATQAAITELDAEIGGILVKAGQELASALERRGFADRLRDQLSA